MLENRCNDGGCSLRPSKDLVFSAASFLRGTETLKSVYWGVTAADFDRDGWPDILMTVTNSPPPIDENADGKMADRTGGCPRNNCEGRNPWRLFQNQGKEGLHDVTNDKMNFKQINSELDLYSSRMKHLWSSFLPSNYDVPPHAVGELKQPVVLDLDLDGWPDVFLPGSPSILLRNHNGTLRFAPLISQDNLMEWNAREAAGPGHYSAASDLNSVLAILFGKLVFSACAADFNQDGNEDLFLGVWNGNDIVLLGHSDGHLRIGFVVAKSFDKSSLRYRLSEHRLVGAFENTMGLGCGDLDSDGFPDVVLGAGTPVWGSSDILLCNLGNSSKNQKWLGFARCDESLNSEAADDFVGFLGDHTKHRTHGIAFADVNDDGRQDLLVSRGGFSKGDESLPEDMLMVMRILLNEEEGSKERLVPFWPNVTTLKEAAGFALAESGCHFRSKCGDFVCDNRDNLSIYLSKPREHNNVAMVRLQSRIGVREALGARLLVTIDGKGPNDNFPSRQHHLTVRSSQAFGSQSSSFQTIALGSATKARVSIVWPACPEVEDVRDVRSGERVTFEGACTSPGPR